MDRTRESIMHHGNKLLIFISRIGASPRAVDRREALTQKSPFQVSEVPVKSVPVNMVIEQPWRALMGAPTSAAVARATLKKTVEIVERSFMFVLRWFLG